MSANFSFFLSGIYLGIWINSQKYIVEKHLSGRKICLLKEKGNRKVKEWHCLKYKRFKKKNISKEKQLSGRVLKEKWSCTDKWKRRKKNLKIIFVFQCIWNGFNSVLKKKEVVQSIRLTMLLDYRFAYQLLHTSW